MSKQAVFADRAALLDPACQQYAVGLFDVTVPANEVWYVFNEWYVRRPIAGPYTAHPFFHRKIGIENAKLLPPGTQVLGTNADSFMWYARPALVQSDPRYADGESLYYERVARLRTLPLYDIGAHRPAGSPVYIPSENAAFPSDFTKGLISHVSCHDCCWVTLNGGPIPGSSKFYIANTLDEINDIHQQRFTASVMQPFLRSQWTGLKLGHGIAGDVAGQPTSYPAWGSLAYYKLPSDW